MRLKVILFGVSSANAGLLCIDYLLIWSLSQKEK